MDRFICPRASQTVSLIIGVNLYDDQLTRSYGSVVGLCGYTSTRPVHAGQVRSSRVHGYGYGASGTSIRAGISALLAEISPFLPHVVLSIGIVIVELNIQVRE